MKYRIVLRQVDGTYYKSVTLELSELGFSGVASYRDRDPNYNQGLGRIFHRIGKSKVFQESACYTY